MVARCDDQSISPRIARLQQIAKQSHRPRLAAQRAEIYERVYRQAQADPPVLRAALALEAFLREKDLVLSPDDLIAGHTQYFEYAYPTALGDWTPFLREKDGPLDPDTNLSAAPVYPPIGRATTPFVYCREDGTPRTEEESHLLEQFCRGIRAGLYFSWPGGHAIAGYDCLLARGLGNLARSARGVLAAAASEDQPFARASLTACEAATAYVLRYAECAEELSQSSPSAEQRQCMERIAAACRHVATEPPRTFFEAVQLLWLGHEIITCEQQCGSMSLGRMDQYLYPYYARDLASGAMSQQVAAELIEGLWCKFAHLRRGFQNITLGGRNPTGGYAANELSCLCLRASRKLRMDQPLLSVRWSLGIPAEFWEEVQALVQTGTGFPALFNDEVAVAAKRRVGVAEEDAENYGIVGCVELSVPGKEFAHAEGLRINWAKVLELMLNEGECALSGERLQLSQPHNLDAIGSFEEFYAWYRAELAHFVDIGVRGLNVVDANWPQQLPYPFLSSLMDGCLQRRLDVTAGGTQYNLSSVNGMGMADVADSLTSIRRLVFTERRISLSDLVGAVRRNFADGEGGELRAAALAGPHFGNDEDEPDRIVRELAEDFSRQIDGYRNPRGGRFQTGLYSVENHARKGKLTAALPSGRHAGLALANALSPCQGRDTAGPTAVVRSVTRLDHSSLGNGMVLDLKFHPAFFDDESRRQAFRALVEAYFEMGGLEMQFNVVSRETLLAAQRTPKAYRDLLVRVSGFSAYFVDLDRVCQDEIIARTEQAAI